MNYNSTPVCTDLAINSEKSSPDKSLLILWYTESKAKFTGALQMVYTGTSSASLDFARSVQTAVFAASGSGSRNICVNCDDPTTIHAITPKAQNVLSIANTSALGDPPPPKTFIYHIIRVRMS